MNKLKDTCYYCFILLVIISFSSCSQGSKSPSLDRLKSENDSLTKQLQIQQETTDSLLQTPSLHQSEHSDPILFGKDFRDIENPAEFINSNLREQTELIPLEAVLGGTMAFRRIEVLNEKWVMATYDDGHIQGQAIYEYRLIPQDSLEFTIRLHNHP